MAAGGTVYPGTCFCWTQDRRPERPKLSDQEERVLVAYASGATPDAAARRAGIKPGTAKQYLDRVKEKYRLAGRPTAPSSISPIRVREDGVRWR